MTTRQKHKAKAMTQEARSKRRLKKVVSRTDLAYDILIKAEEFRRAALEEYNEVKNNPDVYDFMDPGDAEVTLEGNGHNVLDVLNFLKLLGLPDCDT